jgi:hypothetical protein
LNGNHRGNTTLQNTFDPRSGSWGDAAIGLLAASGCRKGACHPEGDVRRSWKSLAANAEQARAAA